MLIYFVRHGQTPSNKERRYQTAHTPLSAEGEVQATKIADRFKDLQLDAIWSSPMTRAQQTAEFINQYHHLPIMTVDNLREIKRASILEGKLVTDPSIQHIRDIHSGKASDPFFRYEDSESFADVVTRAEKVIAELEKYAAAQSPNHTLLITSHGIVLAVTLLKLILNQYGTPAVIADAVLRTKIANTGISMAKFDQEGWRVLSINDNAHL